jgi:hypothetical protein
VEAQDPRDVQEPRQSREPAEPARDGAVAADRLIHGEGAQAEVDHAPDPEHVAGRDDVDLVAVTDLAGLLAVDRQSVRGAVDGEGHEVAHHGDDATGEVTVARRRRTGRGKGGHGVDNRTVALARRVERAAVVL